MPNVIACPNCEKKLAVKEELKGRALICPQCKGRFTVPSGDSPADPLGLSKGGSPSADDGGMGFLDTLGPSAAAPLKSAGTSAVPTRSPSRPAAAKTAGRPGVAASASRAANGRAKKQAEQMMLVYIGGGIAAAVLLIIVVAVALSGHGGSSSNVPTKKDKILFGLSDSTRHKLFKDMITAVDEHGITAECKRVWFRLADECNPQLDHSHLKDILDEGFSRQDWDQPAPASITNKNRATRMEWNAARNNGPDPILAL